MTRLSTRFALALAAMAFQPALALESHTVERRFPLAADQTLRLATVAGTVEVVPGTTNEVVVTIKAHGERRDLVQALNLVRNDSQRGEWAVSFPVDDYVAFHYPELDHEGDSWDGGFFGRLFAGLFGASTGSTYLGKEVRVTATSSRNSPTLWADLRVAVPASGRVEIRSLAGPMKGTGALAGELRLDTRARGSVTIESFRGTLEVDTGSGRVDIGRAEGKTSVDTGSGGIRIAELIGDAVLDTGSGGIEVDRVDGGRVVADTGSGGVRIRNGRVRELIADTGSGGVKVLDVEVETLQADTGSGGVTVHSSLASARDLHIDTGSGRVEIVAGPAADFTIAASLGSGRLRVGYDDARLEHDGREVVGATRGSGKTRIVVDTGSGGCEIRPAS